MAKRGGEVYIDITGHSGKLDKNMKKVERRAESMGSRLTHSARRAKLAYLAVAAAIGVVLKKYMDQEKAEALLDSALASSGQNVKERSRQLRQLAVEMQELTIYGDEHTLQAMTLATNYGVLAGQMEQVVKQAMGLVALRGGQLKLADAIRYVVFAHRGLFGELGQSLPILRTANTAQEKMVLFQKLTAAGWKQVRKEQASELGQLLSMKNRWGDVAERIGKTVMPAFEGFAVMLDHTISLVDKLTSSILTLPAPSKEFRDWEERWAGMSKGPELVKAKGVDTGEFYQGRMLRLWQKEMKIREQRRGMEERYGLALEGGGVLGARQRIEYDALGAELARVIKEYEDNAKKLSELPLPGAGAGATQREAPRALVGLTQLWRGITGANTVQDKMLKALEDVAKNTKETADGVRDGEGGGTMAA